MIVRRINPSASELYHHGIKGQEWGVQNGPPYPLDSSISTGSQLKKAQKKVSKDIKKIAKSSRGSKETTKNVSEYLKNNMSKNALDQLNEKSNEINKLMKDTIPDDNTLNKIHKQSKEMARKKIGKKENFDDEEFYDLAVVEETDDIFFENLSKEIRKSDKGKKLNKAISEYNDYINDLSKQLVGEYSNDLLKDKDKHYVEKGSRQVKMALNKIGNTTTIYNKYTDSVMLDIEKIQLKNELKRLGVTDPDKYL